MSCVGDLMAGRFLLGVLRGSQAQISPSTDLGFVIGGEHICDSSQDGVPDYWLQDSYLSSSCSRSTSDTSRSSGGFASPSAQSCRSPYSGSDSRWCHLANTRSMLLERTFRTGSFSSASSPSRSELQDADARRRSSQALLAPDGHYFGSVLPVRLHCVRVGTHFYLFLRAKHQEQIGRAHV